MSKTAILKTLMVLSLVVCIISIYYIIQTDIKEHKHMESLEKRTQSIEQDLMGLTNKWEKTK